MMCWAVDRNDFKNLGPNIKAALNILTLQPYFSYTLKMRDIFVLARISPNYPVPIPNRE